MENGRPSREDDKPANNMLFTFMEAFSQNLFRDFYIKKVIFWTWTWEKRLINCGSFTRQDTLKEINSDKILRWIPLVGR